MCSSSKSLIEIELLVAIDCRRDFKWKGDAAFPRKAFGVFDGGRRGRAGDGF